MTRDEALAFLRSHQPMPSDWDIAQEECDTYRQVIRLFKAHPDPQCIPLLLGNLSTDTGLGMYQYCDEVFARFPRAELTPHLIAAMRSPDPGTRYWAVNYAPQFQADEMFGPLERLLASREDEGTHYLALAMLHMIWRETKDAQALGLIRARQASERDPAARQLIQEVLAEADATAV